MAQGSESECDENRCTWDLISHDNQKKEELKRSKEGFYLLRSEESSCRIERRIKKYVIGPIGLT